MANPTELTHRQLTVHPNGADHQWKEDAENKAVLNGQEYQYAINLKPHRLDFTADLFDGHPLRFVLWPEGAVASSWALPV